MTVEDSVRWLGSKVVDADTFGELLDHLSEKWADHDQVLLHRREEAARVLLHAEQRNLLAQKLAAEFVRATEGLEVADFVVDFLRNSWAQVVAEAELSCADGSTPTKWPKLPMFRLLPHALARVADLAREFGVAHSTGEEFDASYNRGAPLDFPLGAGRVIQGWDQGVSGMKVGGRRQLVIPPHLGYGDRGAGGVIKPGETLIFVVDLVAVK